MEEHPANILSAVKKIEPSRNWVSGLEAFLSRFVVLVLVFQLVNKFGPSLAEVVDQLPSWLFGFHGSSWALRSSWALHSSCSRLSHFAWHCNRIQKLAGGAFQFSQKLRMVWI